MINIPEIPESLKALGDVISISAVSATLMNILPPVAAILTIIWSIIRIYETKTIQQLLNKPQRKRKRKDDK